jgi:hypothetical protein
MINLSHYNFKLLLPTALTVILSAACGGGGGAGGTGSNNGFNTGGTTNTKPEISTTDKITATNPLAGSGIDSSATPIQSSQSSVSSKSSTPKSSSFSSSSSSQFSSSSARSSRSVSAIDLTPPTAPVNFRAVTVQFDRVTLAWEPSTDGDAIFYKIYRDQVQINTIHGVDTTYSDFDVASGKSYTYSISAVDASENWSQLSTTNVKTPNSTISSNQNSSALSSNGAASTSSTLSNSSVSADTTKPAAPDQVTKMYAYSSQVDINWTAATDNVGVTSYKIYRDSVLIKTVAADILSYSDKTTSPDISYWYGVSAGDAAGNWSSQKLLNVKTPIELIATSVTLKWLPPTQRENQAALSTDEIGGYEVRYKTIQESSYNYKFVSGGTTNQIILAGLTSDYSFEIAIFDTNGLFSNFINIKPQ